MGNEENIGSHLKDIVIMLVGINLSYVLSLGLSIILDSYINDDVSNIIGLTFNYVIDFFIQEYFFIKKIDLSHWFILTYVTISVISILLSHYMFISIKDYIKKHKTEYYDKYWKKHVTFYRMLVATIVYVIYQFPLYKFVVFKIRK